MGDFSLKIVLHFQFSPLLIHHIVEFSFLNAVSEYFVYNIRHKYHSSDKIKEDEMGGACGTRGG
jgi:hypothetical protein